MDLKLTQKGLKTYQKGVLDFLLQYISDPKVFEKNCLTFFLYFLLLFTPLSFLSSLLFAPFLEIRKRYWMLWLIIRKEFLSPGRVCTFLLSRSTGDDHFPFPIIINGHRRSKVVVSRAQKDIHNFFVRRDDLCHWGKRNIAEYFIFAHMTKVVRKPWKILPDHKKKKCISIAICWLPRYD